MVQLCRFFILFSLVWFLAANNSFAQNISGINPSNGNLGQSLTVSISGQSTNFGQGTSTTNVWFSQGSSTLIYPNNVTIINSGQLDAGFLFSNSFPAGFYDVNVDNSIDGLMTIPSVFLLNPNPNPPTLLSSTPSVANAGQVLTVSISGQFTNFGQGTSTANVWFSQGTSTLIFPNSVNVISDTRIDAVFSVPSNTLPGYYDLNSYDDLDGELILSNGLLLNPNLNPPVILSVTPSVANAGQTLTVTISGQFTSFGQGTSTANVWFSQGTSTLIFPDNVNVISDTQIDAVFTIPTDTLSGYYDVNSYDILDGQLTLANGFLIHGCTLTSTTSSTESTCGNNNGYATVNPSGGTPPYSFVWDAGQTTQTISGLFSGIYSAIVVDNSGCKSSASVFIAANTSSASLTMVQDIVDPLVWYAYPVITGAAPFTYLWSFGDGNTSILPNPTHNYATAGHYNICLTIADTNGCSSSTCDSTYRMAASGIIQYVTVVNPLVTGIESLQNTNDMSIYPNPTSGVFNLQMSKFENAQMEIYNIYGECIYRQIAKSSNCQIDLSEASSGIYFLQLKTSEGTDVKKIVVSH